MPKLVIDRLCKTMGKAQILRDISLELETGEFLVLLGASGCGKTTLLNLIAGLDTLTAGEVRIDGRVVNRVPPKDRDIAMVFQSYALYPAMTVAGNIAFPLERRGVPRGERDAAVSRVAESLQIAHLLDRKPAQLSGGQRQRVAMARALVRDPQIFLFDEPLSNLDSKLRAEMRAEIKRMHQRLGATVVYVTHDQVEAMSLATRIAVLKEGRILQCAPPQDIYDGPADLYVAGFIGSPPMNFIPARLVAMDGRLGLSVTAGKGGECDDDWPGGVQVLPLPSGSAADSLAGRVGEAVILGVRPEAIGRGGESMDESMRATIRGRVGLLEPTGADMLTWVRVGERDIIVRLPPSRAPHPGEVADFAIDMTRAVLFDPRDGRLITTCAAR